jgi:hypothetical protein
MLANMKAKLLLKSRDPVKPVHRPSIPRCLAVFITQSHGPLNSRSATALCICICSLTRDRLRVSFAENEDGS